MMGACSMARSMACMSGRRTWPSAPVMSGAGDAVKGVEGRMRGSDVVEAVRTAARTLTSR